MTALRWGCPSVVILIAVSLETNNVCCLAFSYLINYDFEAFEQQSEFGTKRAECFPPILQLNSFFSCSNTLSAQAAVFFITDFAGNIDNYQNHWNDCYGIAIATELP